jgi:hypothetical protein
VISVLKLSGEERARRGKMRKGWKEYRKFMKSLPYMGDSAPLIREDRERGHGDQ